MLTGSHHVGAGLGGLTQHRAPSVPHTGPLNGPWSLSHGLNPGLVSQARSWGGPKAPPVQVASPTRGGPRKVGRL